MAAAWVTAAAGLVHSEQVLDLQDFIAELFCEVQLELLYLQDLLLTPLFRKEPLYLALLLLSYFE